MQLNNHKIAFIICTNNPQYCNECTYYISKLDIPNGFETEIITIEDATYITKAYNSAIQKSNAKYKVYLHQDVFLLRKDFIAQILKIFENPKIGMIGFAGITTLKPFFTNGFTWDKGSLYVAPVTKTYLLNFGEVNEPYAKVQAIDGMLMVTQYDLPWRDDLFTGWDYYDISQSMVFLQNGFDLVVPNTEKPWLLHDHGILNYKNYFHWRDVFLAEYGNYVDSISIQ